jgi:hypothetical protein
MRAIEAIGTAPWDCCISRRAVRFDIRQGRIVHTMRRVERETLGCGNVGHELGDETTGVNAERMPGSTGAYEPMPRSAGRRRPIRTLRRGLGTGCL